MGTSKATTETTIPEWQTQFMTGVAQPLAERLANTPVTPYGGQFAPGMSAYTTQAGQAYGDVAGMTPQDFAARTQANMNPYQQQVIDASLAQMNRTGDVARTNLEAGLIGSGAYGSRGEVARGEFEANQQASRDQLIASLTAQGYGQAQGVTQQQIGNQLAGAGGLMGAGGAEMALGSQQLAGQYGEFNRQQDYPMRQLAGVLGFGGGNYGSTTTQTQKPGLFDFLTAGASLFM